jgi:NADH-quinone oxidoreductase subunit J
MGLVVFIVGAAIIAAGAIGVVTMRNPVHCALSLVMTLFGVAVLFVQLDAHFLAVVQVIVYAGAIVILFLFVLMLLGVDRAEDLRIEPIKGQRPMALLVGVALVASALAVIVSLGDALTGSVSKTKPIGPAEENAKELGELLFTRYAFAFEITGVLLTIAVVAAVIFARKVKGELQDVPPSAMDAITARDAAADDVTAELKVDEGAKG